MKTYLTSFLTSKRLLQETSKIENQAFPLEIKSPYEYIQKYTQRKKIKTSYHDLIRGIQYSVLFQKGFKVA